MQNRLGESSYIQGRNIRPKDIIDSLEELKNDDIFSKQFLDTMSSASEIILGLCSEFDNHQEELEKEQDRASDLEIDLENIRIELDEALEKIKELENQ